jgi:hypothetical protein
MLNARVATSRPAKSFTGREILRAIICSENRDERFGMDNRKRLFINIGAIVLFSAVCAFVVVQFDNGGTRWLKFVLYLFFFASISSASLFSSNNFCSRLSSRLMGHPRKRS